ncbi:MAG: hypothetical protein RLZZ399_646 [Verrucomicrobiota bacterium]|jgi:uncharacterized protein YbaP (TraB family)
MKTPAPSRKTILLTLGLLLFLRPCQGADTPRVPSKNAEPLLWIIRDQDSTVYLYGTIHLRRKGGDWGGPKAKAALAASQRVWTEVLFDPAEENAAAQSMLALGVDPTRKLSEKISPAKKERLTEVAKTLGIPIEGIEPMRPWLAGIQLAMGSLVRSGYDPALGVDRLLDAEARKASKARHGLESAKEQIQMIAGLGDSTQIELLDQTLTEFQKGPQFFGQLEADWEQGREDKLAAVGEETKNSYPELYKVLLVERNRRWAEKIQEILAGSGVDFIAVGTMHLVGPDSVQRMLESQQVRARRLSP